MQLEDGGHGDAFGSALASGDNVAALNRYLLGLTARAKSLALIHGIRPPEGGSPGALLDAVLRKIEADGGDTPDGAEPGLIAARDALASVKLALALLSGGIPPTPNGVAAAVLQGAMLGNAEGVIGLVQTGLLDAAAERMHSAAEKGERLRRRNRERASWHEYALNLWAAMRIARPNDPVGVLDIDVADTVTASNAEVRSRGGTVGFGPVKSSAVEKLRRDKAELLAGLIDEQEREQAGPG